MGGGTTAASKRRVGGHSRVGRAAPGWLVRYDARRLWRQPVTPHRLVRRARLAERRLIRGGTATRWQQPRAHTNLPVPDDGPQNAKLRDGRIDIKRLQQVDDDGLDYRSPCSRRSILSAAATSLSHFPNGICRSLPSAGIVTRSKSR